MGQYTVRNIEWDRINVRGIPLDCIGLMNYFNRALETGAYPLIPRSNPITEEEILRLWIPSINSAITYVAADNNSQKVVCGGTLFLDSEKKIGELSITKDPDYPVKGVGTSVTKAIVEDAISKGISASIHTSVENTAMIRVMEKLGYGPGRLVSDYERYRGKIRAISFDAHEWVILPR